MNALCQSPSLDFPRTIEDISVEEEAREEKEVKEVHQATRQVDTLQDSETLKKTTEITRRSRISFEADLRLI